MRSSSRAAPQDQEDGARAGLAAPSIKWAAEPACDLPCPVCRSIEPKPNVLTVTTADPDVGTLALHECKSCSVKFFPDLIVPDYEADRYGPGPVKFYVEVGAGLDVLVAPLASLSLPRGAHYLEVGCGYGFAVDYAAHALGLNAIGIDPSILAEEGRKALGANIINGYLTPKTDLAEQRFDVVFASEVIEHVLDPDAFMAVLAGRLADDGVVVLSTPDAASVSPETSSSMLTAVLTPGLHYALFSETGLELLLRRAGFNWIRITRRPHTLIAAAGRGKPSVSLDRELDPGDFQAYLDARRKSVAADSPIAHGLTYRLLKSLTNQGQYIRALTVFEDLRDSIQRVYGLDLDRPEDIAIEPSGLDFDEFALSVPISLSGIAYFRGVIALNHEYRWKAAQAYFDLTWSSGNQLREQLQQIGADDPETQDLSQRSRHLALLALAYVDPGEATRRARELYLAAGPDADTGAALSELFVRLVNRGELAIAATLTDLVAGILESNDARTVELPPRLVVQTLEALGVLGLNLTRSPVEAQIFFARAERAAQRWQRSSEPSTVGRILWELRFKRLLASLVAGDARRAIRLARLFHKVEPEAVSEVTMSKVNETLQQHPEIVAAAKRLEASASPSV